MVPQLIKKFSFSALYGSKNFITLFTTNGNCYQFWVTIDKSTSSHPTRSWLISILSAHLLLGLPSDSFIELYPQKPCKHFPSPYTCHMTRPSHPPDFGTKMTLLECTYEAQFYVILSILHFLLSLLQSDRRHCAFCCKATALREFADLWTGSAFRCTICTITLT